MRCALALVIMLMMVAPGQAEEFLVQSIHFNPKMRPKEVVDVITECAKSDACAQIVSSVAKSVGGPGASVAVGLAMKAVPKRASKSEETYTTLTFPSGYTYCRSEIKFASIVPASGKRASKFWYVTRKSEVVLAAWTPRRGFSGGKSWVDMRATVVAVKADRADHHRATKGCRSPKEGVAYQCQGKPCTSGVF